MIYKSFIAILSFASLLSCASVTIRDTDESAMYKAIGEMITTFDEARSHKNGLDPFGSGPVSTMYVRNYNLFVKELPADDRIEYFFAGFFHLGFENGGPSALFLDTVCADEAAHEFKRRLQQFVETSKSASRHDIQLRFAEKTVKRLEIRLSDRQKYCESVSDYPPA